MQENRGTKTKATSNYNLVGEDKSLAVPNRYTQGLHAQTKLQTLRKTIHHAYILLTP